MKELVIEQLMITLEERFNNNMYRHPGLSWNQIKGLLESRMEIIKSILKMEESGGEPDVFVDDKIIYVLDFSKETPKGRRSLCYDEPARQARTKFPPVTSAVAMADQMGVTLLDEVMYQKVQTVEPLDEKTSSWLLTPKDVRTKGGALFGDRRYGRTFIYHNGADSYYGVRGFRGLIRID